MRTIGISLLAIALAVAVPSTATASAPPASDSSIRAIAPDSGPVKLVITTVINHEITIARTIVERVVRVHGADLADRAMRDSSRVPVLRVAILNDSFISNGRSTAGLLPYRHRQPVPLASNHRLRCSRVGPAALPNRRALRPPNFA